MQLALRPYATAGVALVGASVIAVSPVAVPSTAVDVRDTAVELSALVNPIDAFTPIVEAALANAKTLGLRVVDNPAPILSQILTNQINGIGNIGGALEAQIGVLPQLPQLLRQTLASEVGNLGTLGGLSQEFLQNVIGTVTGGALQEQIQLAIDSAKGGDFGGAFADLAAVPLLLVAGEGLENLLVVLPAFIPALQQPLADAARLFPIAAGPLTNGQGVIAALPTAALGLGIGVLSPVISVASAAGDTIDGLLTAAETRDPELVFNTIVNEAAAATSSVLDGALNPDFGIAAGLQGLREAIAAAITTPSFPPAQAIAEVAKIPSTAAQSFTLTAPLEKAPEPKALTTSGDEKTGSTAVDASAPAKESTGTTTPTNNKGDLKGGNLFTPGSTSTKGGRHRADTGSLGEGLRDAIKGLTGGLGRDKKSESSSTTAKSGESASSSSGSGGANSGGGSEK